LLAVAVVAHGIRAAVVELVAIEIRLTPKHLVVTHRQKPQ
jgi:hypothetical protein